MEKTTPNYLTVKYGEIEVSWLPELDGGGRTFGLDYLPVVKEVFGKVGRAYEFCCGPAFIGFALLAEGLCDSLCLSDINPVAVAAVQDTIRRNGLENRVSVYLSDSLNGIPASEKWDLVVSNPPHFEVETVEEYDSNIRLNDQNWRIHEQFYAKVEQHLTPGGTILMQEYYLGSETGTFAKMIAANGMEVIDSFGFNNRQPGVVDVYFYIWIQRKGGGLAMQRGAHPQFVFNEPEVLALSTSVKTVSLAVSSSKQYRLQIDNTRPAPAPIVIYKRRFGLLWRQALDSFMTAAPAATTTGRIIRFGPGHYQVRAGNQTLATLLAN